jgi:ACS family tartrate transporter-like MFS transporter
MAISGDLAPGNPSQGFANAAATGGVALMLLSVTHSTALAVVFLSFRAIGVYGFFGPFWALPSGFLTGFSAAIGLALVNSTGNLAGFVGPYAIGAMTKTTRTLYAGLAFARIFMLAAAILVVLLPKSADHPKSLTVISS